jgi:hypothetical protein
MIAAGVKTMMGERQVDQGALFYEFSLEKQVPADHMLRSIDRFVDLGDVRAHLAVVTKQVVHGEAADRWLSGEGSMGAVHVVDVQPAG